MKDCILIISVLHGKIKFCGGWKRMNDYKKIQKMVAGNLKHENIKVSDLAKNINLEYLKGSITSVEAVKKI